MINQKIILNLGEQEVAKLVANLKLQHEIDIGKGDNITKITNDSNEKIRLEGVASEIAFCKLFNIMPDLSFEHKSSFDNTDPGDTKLHTNHIVDIKSTKYKNGRLISSPWKKSNTNIDLYALMIGEFPEYTFKGFITHDEFFKKERLQTFTKGKPAYVVEQYELKELEKLLYG